MKILQVCPRYYPNIGGVEEHVRNISERLAKNNELTVATTDPSGNLPSSAVTNGVKVLRFKSFAPSESYFYSKTLHAFLKEHSNDYDVVHAHSFHAFPSLFAARAKDENKLVYTPHYHATGHTFFRSILVKPYKYVAKKTFEAADKIVCVSKYERTLVVRDFKVDGRKIATIPNGVDPFEFKGIRRALHENKVLLSVGRLEKYKGLQYVIHVLPLLGPEFKLEIIGKGPYEKPLHELVNKLHLDSSVTFYSHLNRIDLLQKYVDADLFVLLSSHEAFGLTVAESLCAGVPCIVANASGLTEWIDNVNCFGIDLPININTLAVNLKENIGKKIFKPNLASWDEIAKQLENLYSKLPD